jgi:tRNA threonylcarbamoyladenosine biosynthesis protein TsaB
MVVAAIDTSHRVGGVALARDGDVLASARFGAESSHLVELGRTLDRLLAENGLAARDVERLALVRGPGSFTGLRIGMAFVKGLCAGLGADVVTVGTLELLALPHLDHHETVCTLVDAFKKEVYGAVFGRAGAESPAVRARVVVPPCAMEPRRFLDALPSKPALFVGSGVARYLDVVRAAVVGAVVADASDSPPSVEHLARVAHRLEPLTRPGVRSLEPDYIRSSGAKLKRLKPIDPR